MLSFDQVVKMSQADRIETFANRDGIMRRAFSELGKLYSAIGVELTGKESIFSVLTAAGVRKGTISNAGYAAEAFSLVKTEHLTEQQYESLTFADCVNIRKCRTLGIDKLKGIFALEDISGELECHAEHGIGLAAVKAKEEVKAAIAASVPVPSTPAPVVSTAPVETAPVAPPATPPAVVPTPENVLPFVAPVPEVEDSELEKLTRAMQLCDELEKVLNTMEAPVPVIARLRVLMGQKPLEMAA
jgi:hypothetical protein